MPRKVETEFAYDIGDVVRLRAWEYTPSKNYWKLDGPLCVYQVVGLLAQICEGGIQRKYSARPNSERGHCVSNHIEFLESEIELAEKMPERPKDANTETKG